MRKQDFLDFVILFVEEASKTRDHIDITFFLPFANYQKAHFVRYFTKLFVNN